MWTFLSDGWIYTAMVLWLVLNPFTPCREIWHLSNFETCSQCAPLGEPRARLLWSIFLRATLPCQKVSDGIKKNCAGVLQPLRPRHQCSWHRPVAGNEISERSTLADPEYGDLVIHFPFACFVVSLISNWLYQVRFRSPKQKVQKFNGVFQNAHNAMRDNLTYDTFHIFATIPRFFGLTSFLIQAPISVLDKRPSESVSKP